MIDIQKAREIVIERLAKCPNNLEALAKTLAALEFAGYLILKVPEYQEEGLWVKAAEALKDTKPSVDTPKSAPESELLPVLP